MDFKNRAMTLTFGDRAENHEGMQMLGKGAQNGFTYEDLTRIRDYMDALGYGHMCELIDLRTIVPWDAHTIAESVKKTGRCVVSHEAPRTGGFAAEVAAEIQQRCFLSLEAPVQRVCGYDTPFPLVFEKVYLPDTLKVFEAIKTAVRY